MPPILRALGRAQTFALLALAPCLAPLAAQRPLLHPLTDVPEAARAWDARERSLNHEIVRSAFVRVEVGALADPGGSVRARLFDADYLLDLRHRERVLGYEVWRGTVRGHGGAVIVTTAPDGVTAGSIKTADLECVLAYAADGDVHVVHELDSSRPGGLRPQVLVPEPEPAPEPTGTGGFVDNAAFGTVLDVMVFYTPLARTNAGGRTAIESQLVTALQRSTQTSADSNVDNQFRLVYMAETNYTEDGSTADLSRFRSTTNGIMPEVHTLRPTYGGDLMHLITDPASRQYCGVAYLMTTLSTNFRTAAFGVTLRTCVSGNVITHEMGHNIGCHHDRQNAGNAIYPYAYGYRTPDSAYRTVMAYSPGTRADLWSNPSTVYRGYTMGVANSEDNARTIRNTMGTVARFHAMTALLWDQLGGGIPGQLGEPTIDGEGTINHARPIRVVVARYRPNTPGVLIVGASAVNQPLLGGMLVPSPDLALPITGNGAELSIDASALAGLPSASDVWLQAAFVDAAAVHGVSATGGLQATIP